MNKKQIHCCQSQHSDPLVILIIFRKVSAFPKPNIRLKGKDRWETRDGEVSICFFIPNLLIIERCEIDQSATRKGELSQPPQPVGFFEPGVPISPNSRERG